MTLLGLGFPVAPAIFRGFSQEAQEAQVREAARREREAKEAQAREAWEAAKEAEARRRLQHWALAIQLTCPPCLSTIRFPVPLLGVRWQSQWSGAVYLLTAVGLDGWMAMDGYGWLWLWMAMERERERERQLTKRCAGAGARPFSLILLVQCSGRGLAASMIFVAGQFR